MKYSAGICLGASTVSLVRLSLDDDNHISVCKSISVPHNGDPKKVFLELIQNYNPDLSPLVVTGRKFRNLVTLKSISEPEAVEYAMDYINQGRKSYSAVASLGGETFMVYTLDFNGKIENVISKNQCASGTGEFFLQQIKRMGLNIDETIEIARDSNPYKVSGRCSVFCKSDCTHALNKGTPKGDVAAGLSQMIAEKITELLKKARPGNYLLIGGLTQNDVVMNFVRKDIESVDIPPEAHYFEALGAALYAIKNDVKPGYVIEDIFKGKQSSFVFHDPLVKFIDNVTFKQLDFSKSNPGDKCILGLDVGSTTTKAVVIRVSDNAILGTVYIYTNGNPVGAARKCYSELMKQIGSDAIIIGIGVTGSGRHIAGLHALTEGVINEIIAHATAAVYFDSEVDTIFEIGGQDAKYTYIVNKVPADYAMNEACSAGTGSFIEEAAYESLGIDVKDIEKIAMTGKSPPNFSDQCAAFISSDIKTAQQENISREDIVAGLVYSICLNYVNRVKGNRPVGKKIFMQGGVCYNKAIPVAMAALTGQHIIVPPEPGLMGAFGVALEVREKIEIGLMKEKKFSLSELAERDVKYHKPFTCMGGHENCDLRCQINMIEIDGGKYPFGGACDKYYNIIKKTRIKAAEYDLVRLRNELLFEKYSSKAELPRHAPTVGINQSFLTMTLFPLYSNFFSELGFRVVLSDDVDPDGTERELSAMCYPAQVSLGLFQNLIRKNPDYIFVPNHLEMDPEDGKHQRLDNNCSCIFVSGEPYFLRQAFKEFNFNGKFIAPVFNFGNGFEVEEEKFIEVGKALGIHSEKFIRLALHKAIQMQNAFRDELISEGNKFLAWLNNNPDSIAVILVGRTYNAFTEFANKGIPQKISSRGIHVIPYDMLDFAKIELNQEMYWESGKKILKVAEVVKHHQQLFAFYVTNYSCAPDSMIIPMFRKVMGTKPSLTLELDGHTADAGINTRIDAAIDIIKNYRKLHSRRNGSIPDGFKAAQVEFGQFEGYFITSDGHRIPLSDPRVEILIPSMGDLATRLFAAGLRSQGFNAIPLPENDPEVLKIGRAHATGKECLPLMLCTGSMLKHLNHRTSEETLVAFFIVQGAGNCRLGYYPSFMKNVITEKKIKNAATIELMHEDGFAGLGPKFSARGIETLMASDVLDDVRSGILANAVDPDRGLEIFDREFDWFVSSIEKDYKGFYKYLKIFAKKIKEEIPYKRNISDSKYIALVGEMFVRRDRFSHKWLSAHFARKGFILKNAYISEWIFYVDYLLKEGLYEPLVSLKNKWERFVRVTYMRYSEYRIKKTLENTGYYKYFKTNISKLVEHGRQIVPLEFKGEPLLIAGTGIHESIEKYCGIISVGPFGCMQTRFAEAVTTPEMNIKAKIANKKLIDPGYELSEVFHGDLSIPFLPIETDGNVYPQVIEARLETFTLQAERIAELIKYSRNGYKSNKIKKK